MNGSIAQLGRSPATSARSRDTFSLCAIQEAPGDIYVVKGLDKPLGQPAIEELNLVRRVAAVDMQSQARP